MPPNIQVETLADQLNRMQQRVTRLENSPQLGNVSIEAGALQILDGTGRLVMSLGYQPDGTIGLGLYDPASGARRILLGQVAGQEVLEFLDNSSRVVTSLGYQPDGTIGMASYDTAGVRQVQVGQTPGLSSLYGLSVRNDAGVLQQVAGAQSVFAFPSQTISSAGSWVTFSDDPVLTATVGPSGMVMAGLGAYCGTAPTDTLTVALSVDGNLLMDPVFTSTPALQVSGGNNNSTFGAATVGGISPGQHSFSHQYYAIGGGPWLVSDRDLLVMPL